MKCIICDGETSFFLKKQWEKPFKVFLKEADFYKCNNCGFTFSKTLFEMDFTKWEELNNHFHTYIENPDNLKLVNQPPYLEQASMLNLLIKNNIIDSKSMIDFGSGMGTLAIILKKYFDVKMPLYDPFIQSSEERGLLYLNKEEIKNKKVVFNSALFEHIISREDIEQINNCVSDDGVLIIHTVICENIPKDPKWFYIEPPVHSALHTNRSMIILMSQLGYISSLYCPTAKCWILFRQESSALSDKIELINKELQRDYFYFKNGFVDYWKGF
jgi:hypothetical protein